MKPFNGIAVLCDEHNNILRVLHDHYGMDHSIHPSVPLSRIAIPGEMGKMLSFLSQTKIKGIAPMWEINVNILGGAKTLFFTGIGIDDHLYIIGTERDDYSWQEIIDFLQLNGAQTEQFYTRWKQTQLNIVPKASTNNELLDEISRLNNELINAQRQLTKKNAELERLNQEKNHFLGMAAHDLRNPLQTIISASEFLLDEIPANFDEIYPRFLTAIHHSSQFMANLVDDLLDIAKIESGNLVLDLAPVDLSVLVERNISFNQGLAQKKQLEIQLTQEPLPISVIDAAKLDQVLNNLISNAIKFSQPGGKIDVRLLNQEQTFLIEVKDYGRGMNAKDVNGLFKPFQRGQVGTGGEKSSGLGLSIVKRIIEGHGGKIWVESEVGKGTTFGVVIPFQPLEEGQDRT